MLLQNLSQIINHGNQFTRLMSFFAFRLFFNDVLSLLSRVGSKKVSFCRTLDKPFLMSYTYNFIFSPQQGPPEGRNKVENLIKSRQYYRNMESRLSIQYSFLPTLQIYFYLDQTLKYKQYTRYISCERRTRRKSNWSPRSIWRRPWKSLPGGSSSFSSSFQIGLLYF